MFQRRIIVTLMLAACSCLGQGLETFSASSTQVTSPTAGAQLLMVIPSVADLRIAVPDFVTYIEGQIGAGTTVAQQLQATNTGTPGYAYFYNVNGSLGARIGALSLTLNDGSGSQILSANSNLVVQGSIQANGGFIGAGLMPNGIFSGDLPAWNGSSYTPVQSGLTFGQIQTWTNGWVSVLSIPMPTNSSTTLWGFFQAGGTTNSAWWLKSTQYRYGGYGLVTTQATTILASGNTGGDSTNWTCGYTNSGANIVVQAKGGAYEAVNWSWFGFASTTTNRLLPVLPMTNCTQLGDAPAGTNIQAHGIEPNVKIAGKFVASSNYTICQASFNISVYSNLVGNARAELWSDDGSGASSLPSVMLNASDWQPASLWFSGNIYFVNMNWALTAGQTYWIAVAGDNNFNSTDAAVVNGVGAPTTSYVRALFSAGIWYWPYALVGVEPQYQLYHQ